MLWVEPNTSSYRVDWESLKNRLLSVCPSCLGSYYFTQPSSNSSQPSLYLLKYSCLDRKGLLHGNLTMLLLFFPYRLVINGHLKLSVCYGHWWNNVIYEIVFYFLYEIELIFCDSFVDVTKILSELEFTIQRVKVMTTPDGRVVDLFFITDGMWVI